MYILYNQDGYFLTKSGNWSDGRELAPLFKTIYKDEAINQLFEANSKDYNLRISILECEINSKKMPLIPNEMLPPELEKPLDNTDLFENEISSAPELNEKIEAQRQ